MNISAISIRNPIPVIMIFLLSLIVGLMSFSSLRVQNFPDMSLPTITISASLAGADPQQLETEVAKKIESSIASLDGVKNISSSIQDGSVSITAEFQLEKPLQEALDEVRSAVSSISSSLPAGMNEPIVNKVNFSSSPILVYTIGSQQMSMEQLSWFIDNEVSKQLLSINGVGSVKRVGGAAREVQILIDPIKLKALGLTVAEVSSALKNVQLDTTAGKMQLGQAQQPIRAVATVEQADELANMEISSSAGNKFVLGEIAQIKDTVAPIDSAAYFNGKEVVAFEVARTRSASELDVAREVQASIERIAAQTPGVNIKQAINFTKNVQQDYEASMKLLLEGALLAIAVVWIFLKDVRATFVSAIALPLSVIPTFIFMQWFGFSLNIITLLALSLVIGILVDDAIVEVENIERHMGMGKSAIEAAMQATQEIGLAVVATTFTLIAVFLPTAFMSGVPGLIFKQFGWTAALAVFASLVVARLLTPLMAAYLMKSNHQKEHTPAFWMSTYMKVVQWCLLNRFKTMLGAIVFFLASLALIPLLPTGFIPANNNSQTQVQLELPPGSAFEDTLLALEKTQAILSQVPEIASVYSTIGVAGQGRKGQATSDVRQASLTINLKPHDQRPVKQEIEARIRKMLVAVPGVRFKVGSGGNGEKYTLSLAGEEAGVLIDTAKKIESEIRTLSGIGNITSTASLTRAEIYIKVNFSRAAELGVTTNAIAQTIRTATQGDYENALSKLNLATRQIPIVVKMEDEFLKNIDNLNELFVPGKEGMVPLSEVAQIGFTDGPSAINRYNRSRSISLDIELSGASMGEVAKKVSHLPSVTSLPPSVKISPVGEGQMMKEFFAGFGLAMLIGILCIYVVLVLLFKDFMQPITILAALPLSFGGAFVALLLSGNSFSMPSLIGLIMLMGVATKNSILLVEYAIVQRRKGVSRMQALVQSCHARARPIIMTTLAMGAGMLPVAMQWGVEDGSFRAPMAIAVIGGLITSTFLSLLIIPIVFTYIDDLQQRMKKFFSLFQKSNVKAQ